MTTAPNLLPSSYRRRRALRRIVLGWAIVYGLLLLAGGMLWLWQWRITGKQLALVAAYQRRAQPVRQMHQRTQDVRAELVTLEARWQSLRRLAPQDDCLQTLGAIAAAVQKSEGRVRLHSAVYAPVAEDSKSESGLREVRVDLRISAEDDVTAAAFVRQLKQSPRLRSVTLKAAENTGQGGRTLSIIVRAFRTEDLS